MKSLLVTGVVLCDAWRTVDRRVGVGKLPSRLRDVGSSQVSPQTKTHSGLAQVAHPTQQVKFQRGLGPDLETSRSIPKASFCPEIGGSSQLYSGLCCRKSRAVERHLHRLHEREV